MTKELKRIYHPWNKWEEYEFGFYESSMPGKTKKEMEEEFAAFFRNLDLFRESLEKIIKDWPNSCEHNLTNISLNRIAWLGQSSACYSKGIPSDGRAGYSLLTKEEQNAADELAFEYLNKWLENNGYEKEKDITNGYA